MSSSAASPATASLSADDFKAALQRVSDTITTKEIDKLLSASRTLTELRNDRFEGVLKSIGKSSVVMIGEASHGTEEFYRVRAELTKRLIQEGKCQFVSLEADWPDTYRLNRWVHGGGKDASVEEAVSDFVRFPQWMWRNHAIAEFAVWLRRWNRDNPKQKASIYGLDLYSMFTSAEQVIAYLERVDPPMAETAKDRYAVLGEFGEDPHLYAVSVAYGWVEDQRKAVVDMLVDLQRKRLQYVKEQGMVNGDEYLWAEINAKVVRDAEEYYRKSIDADALSWNLRDRHMFRTLNDLIKHHEKVNELREGQVMCALWAHNTHIHDARASEMRLRRELNIGQLVRESFGLERCYSVGFSTHTGTVSASSKWGGVRQTKQVKPSLPASYEYLLHSAVVTRMKHHKEQKKDTKMIADDTLFVMLRSNDVAISAHDSANMASVREVTMPARLQRAIGVQYISERERTAHYHYAVLPLQFDSVLHLDTTSALQPLDMPMEKSPYTEPEVEPPKEEELHG